MWYGWVDFFIHGIGFGVEHLGGDTPVCLGNPTIRVGGVGVAISNDQTLKTSDVMHWNMVLVRSSG